MRYIPGFHPNIARIISRIWRGFALLSTSAEKQRMKQQGVTRRGRERRPRLLWLDLTDGCASTVLRPVAAEYFDIEVSTDIEAAQSSMQRFAPHVVCFEFEHAHATQLRAMRNFKLTNPSLPLLMLTTSHSEALAIWAFRVRVWNYLVKPVSPSELRANFSTLARLVSDNQGPSRSVRSVGALLPRDVVGTPDVLGAPSLQAALAHVEQYYAGKLRQSAVAASCGMSSSTFSRAFKAQYRMTFSQYLMRYRIGRACRLLRYGSHTATKAGMAVGFSDSSHFARAFRKLLGISPSSYQRQETPLQPVVERRRRARGMPGKVMHRRTPGPLPERRVLTLLEEVDGISKRATGSAEHGELRVPKSRVR